MSNLQEVEKHLISALDSLRGISSPVEPELPAGIIPPERRESVDILEKAGLDQASILELYLRYKKDKKQKVDVIIEPSHTLSKDAAAYILRYPDLKRAWEGIPSIMKEKKARQHYDQFGRREGRLWGVQESTNTSTHTPLRKGAHGLLWKPESESRGGAPVLLTPKAWDFDESEVDITNQAGLSLKKTIDDRGGKKDVNGGRRHYFFIGVKARDLPRTILVKIGMQTYSIDDPTQRHEA